MTSQPDELTIWQRLAEPFPPDKVKRRPGAKSRDGSSAMVLHYIDARDVMDRLDAVVGPEGWEDQFRPREGGAVECRLTVWDPFPRIVQTDGELTIPRSGWTKADVGYPNGENDPEPLKGAYSDALKRAAVKFGIGRFLYDLPQEWLPINQYGRFEDAPASRPAPPQTRQEAPQPPAAPPQGSSTPTMPFDDEPPPPDEASYYGDTPTRDVDADVGVPEAAYPARADGRIGTTNRYGDNIGACTCPKHGNQDVKITKRDGGPYLSKAGEPIGHCWVEVQPGADKIWDRLCWGDLPIPR